MSAAAAGAAADRDEDLVVARYWAAARAAAGVDAEAVTGVATLAELVAALTARHDDRFARVIACCSVLIGSLPVTSADPATVRLNPGDQVEFLPPFAGG